jgi:hypothetical protein
MKDVGKSIHAHSVKIEYTMTDKHCFCKNLADQLVDCIHKEYQVKLVAMSTNFSSLLLKIDSCKVSIFCASK